MQSQVQEGEVIDVTLAATAVSGVAFMLGGMLVVPQTSGGIGDSVACVTEGVFELPKASAADFAAGDIAYWDASGAEFNESAIGYFGNATVVEAAAALTTVVKVKLMGFAVAAV